MPKRSPPLLVRRKLTSLELKKMLKDSIEEPVAVEKGKAFEHFFENLMNQQQGLVFIRKHARSEVGEIDYFYRSELEGHPLWNYPYLFIECKNWKDPISSEKMNHFIRLVKAKNFFHLLCCGIYITTSNFSQPALTTLKEARNVEKVMIITINKKDLSELIEIGVKAFLERKCDEILAKA